MKNEMIPEKTHRKYVIYLVSLFENKPYKIKPHTYPPQRNTTGITLV